MDILKQFLDQVGIIPSVWMPFVLLLAILGLGLWGFLKHHYSGRLETKDSLIALRDAQLQDYRDKLSGASPDEAKARIVALERRLDELAPRRLSQDQIAQLTNRLLNGASEIAITLDVAAPEAAGFNRDLQRAFRAAGWRVLEGNAMGVNQKPRSGIRVTSNPAQREIRARVASALRETGIELEEAEFQGAGLDILVTSHVEA